MPSDMEFAVRFARYAGEQIVNLRRTTTRRKKLDRTDVTGADESINNDFIEAVGRREGDRASVRGEEKSARIASATRVWTIDPIDGTGEYIDDTIPDSERTTCIGLSLLERGRLILSVVNNPFRRELFTAEANGPALLNGRAITCSTAQLRRGVPYDFCHWNGTKFDVRGLRNILGEPLGVYSAIYQACMVAAGRSAFAVFPGDTIHDIAPGALLVARANGAVTDLRGNALRWDDLTRDIVRDPIHTRLGTASHRQSLICKGRRHDASYDGAPMSICYTDSI